MLPSAGPLTRSPGAGSFAPERPCKLTTSSKFTIPSLLHNRSINAIIAAYHFLGNEICNMSGRLTKSCCALESVPRRDYHHPCRHCSSEPVSLAWPVVPWYGKGVKCRIPGTQSRNSHSFSGIRVRYQAARPCSHVLVIS